VVLGDDEELILEPDAAGRLQWRLARHA
jgi:hypothetical protein